MATKNTKKSPRKVSPVGIKVVRTDGGQGDVGRFNVEANGVKMPAALTSFIRAMGAMGFRYKEADALLRDAGIAEPSPNTVRSQLHSGFQGTLSAKELKAREKQKFTNTRSGGHRPGRPGHHGFADPEILKAFGAVLKRAKAYYQKKIAEAKA